MGKRKSESTRSEVVKGAQEAEARHAAAVRRKDAELTEMGFELRELNGLNGSDLENRMLLPYGTKNISRMPDEVLEIKDDEEAVKDALKKNPYRTTYENWRLYAPEWLREVHGAICDRLSREKSISDLKISPDMVSRMIKLVPCLQGSLDLHRGFDCLAIFHDPDAFEVNRSLGFDDKKTNIDPGHEATYWDPEFDTIVTLDMTADIATKYDRSRDKEVPIAADVIVSKVGSVANPGLKHLVGVNLGRSTPIERYDERIEHVANLIVRMYLEKAEHDIPDLRSPDAEERERIKAESEAYQERMLALLEKRKVNLEKQKKKKQSQKIQSKIAKDLRDTSRKAGKLLQQEQLRKSKEKKKK